ncbi:MAG: porin family protein [Balneolales bacterium]
MRRILISSVFLLAFLCYSNAEAQNQSRTTDQRSMHISPIQDALGIGVRGGFFTSDDAETGTWLSGIHGRFRFGPVFGLEAAIDYQGQQEFTIDGDDIETEERDIRNIPITASALIHAPLSPYFVPYGIAGGGVYFTFEEFDDLLDIEDETTTNFGLHLGAGLEVPASRNLAFHGDWRYVFMDDADVDINDQALSGSMFTAGITYYFRKSNDRKRDDRGRR